MTVYAYKLPLFALNGWVGWEEAKIDENNAFGVDGVKWIEETAAMLHEGKALLADMGCLMSGDQKVWFATLPISNGFRPCPAMMAIEDDDVIWLLSPFDLTWLRGVSKRMGGTQ